MTHVVADPELRFSADLQINPFCWRNLWQSSSGQQHNNHLLSIGNIFFLVYFQEIEKMNNCSCWEIKLSSELGGFQLFAFNKIAIGSNWVVTGCILNIISDDNLLSDF